MRLPYVLRGRLRLGTLSFPMFALLSLLLLTCLTLAIVILLVIRPFENRPLPLARSHENFSSHMDAPFVEGCAIPDTDRPRANATLVVLARNSEINDVIKSVKSLERHFNQWYQYPWTFLNNVPFDEDFKNNITALTNARVQFGLIDDAVWNFPEHVENSWEYEEGINQQEDRGVFYGSMESYHKMCRFFSGGFYKHEMVREFDWYWRVEPDVEFFCDITYDPFIKMQESGKKYGFNIVLKELEDTIPNLFRATKAWMKKENVERTSSWNLFVDDYTKQWKIKNQSRFNENYKNIKDEFSMRSRIAEVVKIESILKKIKKMKTPFYNDSVLPEDSLKEVVYRATDRSRLPELQGEQIDNEVYNLFHFWSNFEIARVDLWENPKYESYFQYLEEQKGFYKERWGDAPVHSIALGFLLDLEELHYFRDIGYQHSTIVHCPLNNPNSKEIEYQVSPDYRIKDSSFEKHWAKFDQVSTEFEGGAVGCRCRCPSKHDEIENATEDFLQHWIRLTKDNLHANMKAINIDRMEREVKDELEKEGTF